MSIEKHIPLISASVNQWRGQIGVFLQDLRQDNRVTTACSLICRVADARNCNEAGILGTSADLTGMWRFVFCWDWRMWWRDVF